MAIRRKVSACPEYIDRLVEYSDGELAADERSAITGHVTSCADCRATLARLNSSRERLLNGISPTPVELRRSPLASDRSIQCAATVATIGLMVVATLLVMRPRTSTLQLTKVEPMSAPLETIAAPKMTLPVALWQIAVAEQQARLQESLDLWPKDDSYNDNRERDRQLIATFQSLANINSSNAVP